MKRSKLRLLTVLLLFLSVGWLIPAEKAVRYRVNYDALNLRSGPGTGYQVLGVVVRGDLLELLKKSGVWLKVKCLTGKLKGVEGFLHRNYVQAVDTTVKPVSSSKKQIKNRKAPKINQTQRLGSLDPEDAQMIERIQKKMLSQSLLFLGLIKQMEPRLTDSEVTVKRTPKVKVIKRNALVLDGFVSGSRVIHYPYINESFTVDEDGDDFFKIQLSGRRTGWIHKSFVQNYHEIRYTRGVKNILGNQQYIFSLSDEKIEDMKSREKEGYVTLTHKPKIFKKGDRVLIDEGDFDGWEGVFYEEMSDKRRAVIMLTSVSFSNKLIIPKKFLVYN